MPTNDNIPVDRLATIAIGRVMFVERDGRKGWMAVPDASDLDGSALAWMLTSTSAAGQVHRVVYQAFAKVRRIANGALTAMGAPAAVPPVPDEWVFDVGSGRLSNPGVLAEAV